MLTKVNPPRVVIAAPNSGTGKTTITMGILHALVRRGLTVQSYKVGPDYIDPAFHAFATGRPSINLDGYLLDQETNKMLLNLYSEDADINIIEGVMGLYDGLGLDPMIGSTAQMAKDLSAPIILVIGVKGMSTSAAAIVHGMKTFQEVEIGGVIINQPGSAAHYQMLKKTIESHTDSKVIGYLPKMEDIQMESRHLGLIQSDEIENLREKLDLLADAVEEFINIDQLLEISNNLPNPIKVVEQKKVNKKYNIRLAVAKDKAFSFHYHHNLELLKQLGAELCYFSPLMDTELPKNCNGIYLVGGYPEVFAKELSQNIPLKKELKNKAEQGIPIYAECGGYMFLHESITTLKGDTYTMVGVFKGNASMTKRLQNFGYATIRPLQDSILLKEGNSVRVHEFHRSVVERADDESYKIEAKKENGFIAKSWKCGKQYKNVFGMYPHLYFPSNNAIPEQFIKTCYLNKTKENELL